MLVCWRIFDYDVAGQRLVVNPIFKSKVFNRGGHMLTSQYSSPLKIAPVSGEVEVLVSTSKERGFNEAFIQDLVFRYPSCLPVDQIDRTFTKLIPVCCELRTPAGPLDVLYVTPEGRLVILEAKLWRNPEARRKVVAQILDYAKEFCKWNYEDLQREVSRATKRKGNVLYNLVKEHNADISESDFVDEISRTLSSGRLLLLIVGDGIHEGAAGIANFLTDVGNLQFTFGLVELAIYRAENKELLVQPRVLAKTEIIERTVVSVKDGQVLIENPVEEKQEKVEKELQDYEVYYSEFWPELLNELQLDDVSQPMPDIKEEYLKLDNTFFRILPKTHYSWLTIRFDKKNSQVEVLLDFRKNASEDIYERLVSEKEEINKDLGLDVEWTSVRAEKGVKNGISISKDFDDLFAESNRDQIKGFFSDTVNRFVNTFRPRLQKIVDGL